MKSKRATLIFLVIIFMMTAGMFYYQNIVLPKKNEAQLVTVMITKKDIAKGSLFTTENIGGMKMNKERVLPNQIVNFADLEGKVANSDIYANEFVTKSRVSGDSNGTNQFSLTVEASNLPPTIKTGDYIRVYVQTANNKVLEVYEKKEVVGVNFKKSTSGNDSSVIESLEIHVSDKEIITYFDAQKEGNIILARYNDLTENNMIEVPKYEMYSEELKKLKESTSKSKKKNERSNSGEKIRKYIVKSGDTYKSIGKTFNMTEQEIQSLNPGIISLSPGDKLIVKQD